MGTRSDLFNKISEIGNKVRSYGGTVAGGNKPSLNAISTGLDNIPHTTVTSGSFSITTADIADTAIVLSKDGTTLETKTTPSTTGGIVVFTSPNAVGTYTLTASRSGSQVWTKNVVITSAGNTDVMQPILMDNFTVAEINTVCKNHYVRYMWEIGDYKDTSSFMGSTSTYSVSYVNDNGDYVTEAVPFRRMFLMDYESDELSDNTGMCGAKFIFPKTPSAYNIYGTGTRLISWVGSTARERCSASGTVKYVYANVTSSTTGTYYYYNKENDTFETVELPAGYVSTQTYYTQETTSSDGVIYSGIPSELINNLVSVKVKTWNGNADTTYNALINTSDKIFLPSVIEIAGNRMQYANWYRSGKEGKISPLARNCFCDKYFNSTSTWTRTPSTDTTSGFACWNRYGYVSSNGAHYSGQFAVCVCL